MSELPSSVPGPDLADDEAYERTLGTLAALTDALLDDVKEMDDDAVRSPSRCAGWSRAHVLTHLARNADGLCNLLVWAHTGVETPAYSSREARDADIEAGSGRSASELEADLDAASERFLAEVASLPSDRRHVEVTMSSGSLAPAHEVLWLRIREVGYHHVDLSTGYGFEHLPDWVVARGLAEAGDRLTGGGAPALTLEAGDTRQRVLVSEGGTTVRGRASDLLAWATGRDDGSSLEFEGSLPVLPSWG